MGDLIYFAILGLVAWIVYAKISQKSIIPFKNNATTKEAKKGFDKVMSDRKKQKQKKQNNKDIYMEEEPDLFSELIDEIEDISDHMVHLKDNQFLLFAEVKPCNYFLRSQQEQEIIDSNFEAWLATINDHVRIYLQTRYIDLSEPIEQMKKNLKQATDLPDNAKEYGETMIKDMEKWQVGAPRYEVKRYLIFPFRVNLNELSGVSKDKKELKEKAIDKAFGQLYRRYSASKTILKKSYMEVEMLSTDGIVEVLYHAFNRKKALKVKYKNIQEREMLSNYVTADQEQKRIEIVKELIKENEKIIQKENEK